jgi:K+ transporter
LELIAMGVFDFLRPAAPKRTPVADSQRDKDKSVAGAGAIYFVKWTNKNCTMSDIVKFYNVHEANIFIADCRREGYFVKSWHESKDEQVAAEVERIKAELLAVQDSEIDRYKKMARAARTDLDRLKIQYNAAIAELEQAQKKQADQQETEHADILQAKEHAQNIIHALNPANIIEMCEQLENDSEFNTMEGAAQLRLIKYYANQIVKL